MAASATRAPVEIATEVMAKHYGPDSNWCIRNEFDKRGFTLAQVETDIDHQDIVALIAEGIELDRAGRAGGTGVIDAETGIARPTDEQFARFGKAVAAIFGTSLEWSADETGDVSWAASVILKLPLGDQDRKHLQFWQKIADEVGVEYDAELLNEFDDETEETADANA